MPEVLLSGNHKEIQSWQEKKERNKLRKKTRPTSSVKSLKANSHSS